MKRLFVLLATPLLVLFMTPAANADIVSLLADQATCGTGGNREVVSSSYQYRFDEGTPNDPSDDRITFNGRDGTDVTVDVLHGDAGLVDSVDLQAIKQQPDGDNIIIWHQTSNNPGSWNVYDMDSYVVAKKPFLKIKVYFQGGAVCTMNHKWNPNW